MIPDSKLPALIAILNSLSAIFLFLGYRAVRRADVAAHKKFMVTALFTSAAFLMTYLIYHYEVGSVPYPYHDWTRPIYFIILVPHVILAALMTPFVLLLVRWAMKGDFVRHKKLARLVWPVWMFVSLSGVTVFMMLYVRTWLTN